MILLAFPDNVPELRWLSMLKGSFCPRSLPRPVKGRSQSLALRWTRSFRIGAATTAAAAGIPAHTIKRLGRSGSSDAYTLYVRQSDSSLLHISTVLAFTSGC